MKLINTLILFTSYNIHAASILNVNQAVVENFDIAPPLNDWGTKTGTGTNASVFTTSDNLDEHILTSFTALSGLSELNTVNDYSSFARARWSNIEKAILSNPSGTGYLAIVAKVHNLSGLTLNQLQLNYQLNAIGNSNEEIPGHRVFYSLDGAAGSWSLIPTLSGQVSGSLSHTFTNLNWQPNQTLNVLWVDDNANVAERINLIDQVSWTASTSIPEPSTLLFSAIALLGLSVRKRPSSI